MKVRHLFLLVSVVIGLLFASLLAAADPENWIQKNVSGFGESDNVTVLSIAPFNGQLYAGTSNNSGNGAQLWQQSNSGTWTQIKGNGFNDTNNSRIASLASFDSQLYAGTRNESSGGQVWRTDDGSNWSPVTLTGLDPTNAVIVHFADFENEIYASTWSITDTHGAEIWSSSTGNSGDWTQVVDNGFDGDANNSIIVTFEEYGGDLFAGTDNTATGAEVWSMDDAGVWHQVNEDGFGDRHNWSVTLKEFSGHLYAATYNYAGSDNQGHELWRCQLCNGTDWQIVPIQKGFGTTENRAIRALKVLNGALYAVTYNRTDAVQVWRSTDGDNWNQVNANGFGDSNNIYVLWDNATTIFNNSLYVGTDNDADGGEIWQYLSNNVFLPMIVSGD